MKIKSGGLSKLMIFANKTKETIGMNRYSIVHKIYEGKNFIEYHSITVNKKNLFQIKNKIDMVLNECM
jgi:hypothetical protein